MLKLQNIKNDLKKVSSPKKAQILQRFFKTGPGEYGEGDVFLGVTVPQQRELVKKYWSDINLKDVENLLHSKIHEYRLTVLLILVKKFEQAFKKEDLKLQTQIFILYLKNTKYINNWDLVDLSAPNIIGFYLRDKDRSILYKLAISKNLWERRISILATYSFIQKGESKDTLKISEILLKDKEDLIHKAVGWMLREVGKRIDQNIEESFLKKYYQIMPRTMLRYAIERFKESKRKKYLTNKI
jgi:3-methyladenine DNA glycosylase AlkD